MPHIDVSNLSHQSRKDLIDDILLHSTDDKGLILQTMKSSSFSDVSNAIVAWAKKLNDDEFTILQEKLARI